MFLNNSNKATDTDTVFEKMMHAHANNKMVEDIESSHVESTVTAVDKDAEKRLVRKIDIRIMPFTALIYLFCYLDRSNIGNARILNSSTNDTLLDSNNMSQYQYVIALMIFLVAYSLFEAPSNLALKVFSPNIWLGFLIIGFGAFCSGIAGTRNFEQLAILRFFLGAFEASVFC
ncbi:hypothetical protein H9Q72_010145 [Fusarium xylarioides]|uniref:Major facilitator superfamily (MFS) profile domain-containing protein n=1 Tax=Fusarium xylarioides TaxID=221167 RepID=A0A9P7HTR0_9HYPO|nr:hypothetical protein H9Q72_010145 [Fusarium xylarioides]KAG5807855.1 hypothetical protein H9Q71_007588 [Fusarium xylarioides]KAG5821794.1 hypothetical protein H9Q74_008066 [Fusarium xylarioides]